MIRFDGFGIDDMERYAGYFRRCAQLPSDLSPLIILAWRLLSEESGEMEVMRGYAANLCWHRVAEDGKVYWLAPVGDWDSVDWRKSFDEYVPAGTNFSVVPEHLVNLWREALGDDIEIEEDRDHWDYILSMEQLHEAAGKKYKHFRNERRAFEGNNDYTVEEFSPSVFDELREFHCRAQADIESRAEQKDTANFFESALLFILDSWKEYREAFSTLYGFLLKVNGKCVAYSINEQVTDSHAIGIFAAADYDYKGVNKFAYWLDAKRNLERGIESVNIIDVGEPSFRYVNEHLATAEMLKKFNVICCEENHDQ